MFFATYKTLSALFTFLFGLVKANNNLEALKKAASDAKKALEALNPEKTPYAVFEAAKKAVNDTEKAVTDYSKSNDSVKTTDVLQLAVFLAVFGNIQYNQTELVKLAGENGLNSIGQFGYFARVKRLCERLNIKVTIERTEPNKPEKAEPRTPNKK